MTSIVKRTKQINPASGYLLGNTVSLDAKFIYDPIQFTVGSYGVVAKDGTNIYFDTYANVVTFLITPEVTKGSGSITCAESTCVHPLLSVMVTM